jgi:hypothetical protein
VSAPVTSRFNLFVSALSLCEGLRISLVCASSPLYLCRLSSKALPLSELLFQALHLFTLIVRAAHGELLLILLFHAPGSNWQLYYNEAVF